MAMLLFRSCRTLLLRHHQQLAHRLLFSPYCYPLPLRPTSQQPAKNSSLLLQATGSLQVCNAKAKGEGGGPKLKYDLKPVTKDDVDVTFSRSSGSGGQNVNKLSTKADVRFDLRKQSWIPDEVKDAIRQAEKNRFTKDGVLVMSSQRFRTQAQNLDDALSKLQDMIQAGVEAVTPTETDPETIKRVKQNIKVGKERRLDSKKKDSFKKKERSKKVSLD